MSMTLVRSATAAGFVKALCGHKTHTNTSVECLLISYSMHKKVLKCMCVIFELLDLT